MAFRMSTIQIQTTMSRSQLCLCTFQPHQSPPIWCIKIPSAYVVAQTVYFLNEELPLNADAPTLAFVAVQRLPCGGRFVDWAGPAAITPMFAVCVLESRKWIGKVKIVKKDNWVLRSNTSGSCFCSPLWTPGLRSQCDLWMRSVYQPDCCFCSFSLPCACFLFVLLFKCCETDAEALKCCSVMGWACSVFGRHLRPLSPLGLTGENATSTTPPVMILHCLISPLVQIMSIRWNRVLSAWLSWRPAGAECSGSAYLSQSSVDVFYPRARVSLCRHVRVPPISDCALILYMKLIFCGTWPAWIHFVYICTLMLFTV